VDDTPAIHNRHADCGWTQRAQAFFSRSFD